MPTAAKNVSSPNDYFICTLGDATESLLNGSDIHTVNDFIDHQAMKYPKENAVGFPIPTASEWGYELSCKRREISEYSLSFTEHTQLSKI